MTPKKSQQEVEELMHEEGTVKIGGMERKKSKAKRRKQAPAKKKKAGRKQSRRLL